MWIFFSPFSHRRFTRHNNKFCFFLRCRSLPSLFYLMSVHLRPVVLFIYKLSCIWLQLFFLFSFLFRFWPSAPILPLDQPTLLPFLGDGTFFVKGQRRDEFPFSLQFLPVPYPTHGSGLALPPFTAPKESYEIPPILVVIDSDPFQMWKLTLISLATPVVDFLSTISFSHVFPFFPFEQIHPTRGWVPPT